MWSGWLKRLFFFLITLCQRSWAPQLLLNQLMLSIWHQGTARPLNICTCKTSPSSVIFNQMSPGFSLTNPSMKLKDSRLFIPTWNQTLHHIPECYAHTITNILKQIQKSEIWISLPSATQVTLAIHLQLTLWGSSGAPGALGAPRALGAPGAPGAPNHEL